MYEITLKFKTDNEEYIEHESQHIEHDEALYEANEAAFSATGFDLESWEQSLSFGEAGNLFYHYPIEGNRNTRYSIRVVRIATTES